MPVFRLPCTLTLTLDDNVLRLLDITPAGPDGGPSLRGAHLAGVNADRARRKREDIEALKPKILDLLRERSLPAQSVLSRHGAFSRNATYAALRELRLSGAVVLDGNGCCALAGAKGAERENQ